MQQSIVIRVTPEDYDRWFAAHSSQEDARRPYGMTDGPFYRDANDPNAALVVLDDEDVDRAMGWFKSDAFKASNARAGRVEREQRVAERRG